MARVLRVVRALPGAGPRAAAAWAAVMVVCALVGGAWAQGAAIGDQAGTERYALANGLEVVLVATGEYAHPEGDRRAQVWLIVRAGSMHETEAQRGAAELASRLVWAGTKGLDAETMGSVLGARARGEGKHEPVMVTFDQTLFMASADLDEPGALGRVLGVYAQVLDPSDWVLSEERFRAARDALVSEIGSVSSPELRARQRWLPELLAGTRFGERLPMPDQRRALALTREAAASFAMAHYGAGNALLLVVGDVDPERIKPRIGAALGGVPRGTGEGVLDGRMGIDIGGRAVMGADPDTQREQAALVWFEDRGPDALRPWSVRAAGYDESDMRSMVIDRVAGEVVRHRLGRLGAAGLGVGSEIGVEQLDLWGQVGLVQIGVEAEAGARGERGWEGAMGLLVRECDRLTRDGAGSEELRRARRAVLTRWHREADRWRTLGDRERAGIAHWLVTTGRPMMDMARWDERATRLMSTISEGEILARLRAMVDPRRAAAIALVRGEASLTGSAESTARVRAAVEAALATPLDPIEDGWMGRLSGPLLDEKPRGGEVTRITQHAPSGVLMARLSSGVRVWTRAMDDGEGRVHLTATVWGDGIATGAIGDRRLEAAVQAWAHPASESRSGPWVAVYMREHGIEIEARPEINGAQLRLSAPAGELVAAMELLYVLLDEPMIEPETFESWVSRRCGEERDPLDAAMGMLYGRAGDAEGEPTLDDAQRGLTQIVRNGRIDVGIAGPIDQRRTIEEAARLLGSLGSLAARGDGAAASGAPADRGGTLRKREITVSASDERQWGLALGYVCGSTDDLPGLRATILASMVLGERLNALVAASGFDGELSAQVVLSDAIPGRWALLLRVRCAPGLEGAGLGLLDRAAGELEEGGIDAAALAAAQERLAGSMGRYFDRASYWSARMSGLGLSGREVEDLWTIREGYAAVTSERASDALRAALGGGERFRVRITGKGR